MVGLNKYADKRKREMRRRNHIARDLRTRKFHQRRIDNKDKSGKYRDWTKDIND